MFGLIPPLYRWMAIAAMAAMLFAAGWVKGAAHGQDQIDAMVGKAATETIRLARGRDVVTQKVVIKYATQAAKQQVVTETIIKEVDRYVPSSDPVLSPGFRLFHDAAASGEFPDPAGRANAAAVTAKEAASTVAQNYGDCRADQLRLRALQEWVLEQKKVK